MRWPLTMSGLTVMVSVAWPDLTSTILMPSPWLASSSFHIASAHARARSSGESVALTFTLSSPVVSHVIVIDHDLFCNRLRLASENVPCLELPWLERIVQLHLRPALHQLGAAGRAHAPLAGKGQIDTGAQSRIQDSLAFSDRHLPPFAVDNQRGESLRRRGRGVARRTRTPASPSLATGDAPLPDRPTPPNPTPRPHLCARRRHGEA